MQSTSAINPSYISTGRSVQVPHPGTTEQPRSKSDRDFCSLVSEKKETEVVKTVPVQLLFGFHFQNMLILFQSLAFL